jgi:hypothetical protein
MLLDLTLIFEFVRINKKLVIIQHNQDAFLSNVTIASLVFVNINIVHLIYN